MQECELSKRDIEQWTDGKLGKKFDEVSFSKIGKIGIVLQLIFKYVYSYFYSSVN